MSLTDNKIKVLITSAGSTNGVNVIKALQSQREINLFLIATDSNPLAAGLYLADKHYITTKADAHNFISTILKICKKEKVKIIIPTFSFELPIFAKNKEVFKKNGIKMAISDEETFLVTENKVKTNEYFKKWKIPFPKVYTKEDIKRKK